MPLYDFRCAGCAETREVRAAFAEASTLELVCTSCGGAMTRVISKTAPAVQTFSASASPPHPRPPAGRARARTCEDGAVQLTRPNPFAAELPRRKAAEGNAT
jgi:putative FmdB family regulatory protein